MLQERVRSKTCISNHIGSNMNTFDTKPWFVPIHQSRRVPQSLPLQFNITGVHVQAPPRTTYFVFALHRTHQSQSLQPSFPFSPMYISFNPVNVEPVFRRHFSVNQYDLLAFLLQAFFTHECVSSSYVKYTVWSAGKCLANANGRFTAYTSIIVVIIKVDLAQNEVNRLYGC